MSDRRAREFEKLLQSERELLLAGAFDGLAELGERKTRALAELGDWGLDAERLESISRLVSRNQGLLSAAIRGVEAARRQIATASKASGSLATYDNHGQKTELAKAPGGLERKA